MARICILLPYHWAVGQGGSEHRANALAERLVTAFGHEVIYLARHAPQVRDGYPYRIEQFAGPRLLGHPRWGGLTDAVALYRALTRLKPDVVVQFVACAYTGVAAYYARRTGCPLVWCLASDSDVSRTPNVGVSSPVRHLERAVFRYGAKNATAVIAQTRAQADVLPARYERSADAVIPNFHPVFAGPLWKPSDFTVAWIGNIKALKRPQLFVELAHRLEKVPGIRLLMIGRKDTSPWGLSILDSIERLPNIEYLGELPMADVNRRLEAAHLLVNTSEYEGLPNTLIQAWMREVPTLTTNVDPDGVIMANGLGLVSGDLAMLAATICRLAGDREALAAMGRTARAFAERTYSMDNVDRFVEVIESHIAQSSGVAADALNRGSDTMPSRHGYDQPKNGTKQ